MSSLPSSCGVPPIRSLDGYIRLSFDAFLALDFSRKLAWEDEELREELLCEDIPACRAGYCEWATDNALNPVSVGWAWFRVADGRTFLAPGGISSNVMFVAQTNRDLEMRKTSELLCAWLASENWQLHETVSAN